MNSLTVMEWAEIYLDDVQRRFARKTYDEKRSAFKGFLSYEAVNSDMSVEKINVTIADNHLSEQNDLRSGYAANKDRKNLSCAWDWGVKKIPEFPRDLINPFRTVEKFSEERFPRYVPPEEDFWKIYNIADGQDKIMLLSSLHLASRRGELFRLKRQDIDFKNDTITLWTKKRKGGNLEPDVLPMTKELREAMLPWCRIRLSHDTIDKEHVFICLDKTPFCKEYYGKPFQKRQHFMKRICKKAGVKSFGFHAIRHLTASILYRKGYSVSFIQKVLRHQNPTTIEKYLRSLGIEDVRNGMDEALSSGGNIISFDQKKITSKEISFGG